jgi:hypothetical protein
MQAIHAWIGRDNVERLELIQDGDPVTADAVTRAVLRFGGYCLDTDVVDDTISLADSATVVEVQIGQIAGLLPGYYQGHLIVYDNPHPNGIMWEQVVIIVSDAEDCPPEE